MRISDWSSDVCSSDLLSWLPSSKSEISNARTIWRASAGLREVARLLGSRRRRICRSNRQCLMRHAQTILAKRASIIPSSEERTHIVSKPAPGDRKNGVKGKRGYVRVVIGGHRILKKKKQTQLR